MTFTIYKNQVKPPTRNDLQKMEYLALYITAYQIGCMKVNQFKFRLTLKRRTIIVFIEEEVLASGSALWFSPDGNYVAFAQFNDTLVREYSYLLYGSPGNLDDQYPKTISIRYPKAGETNPIVHVKVIDLMNDEGSKAIYELNADAILYAIKWSDNDHFTSVLMNRVQNKANLYKCDMAKNCVFVSIDNIHKISATKKVSNIKKKKKVIFCNLCYINQTWQ